MTSSIDYFSFPQILGYVAFALAMVTFSQKNDRRFKLCLSFQNFSYAAHFFLLGNNAAAASAMLSVTRNLLSLRTRSFWVAVLVLSANCVLGITLVKSFWSILPPVATAIATISMFRLSGLKLRIGMFCATLLWLTNNLIVGSIGGTLLEIVVAIISSATMYRLYRDSRKKVRIESTAESRLQLESTAK